MTIQEILENPEFKVKIKQTTIEAKALKKFEDRKAEKKHGFFEEMGIRNINPKHIHVNVELGVERIL